MKKTTSKIVKVLTIHSKGSSFMQTLAWWNLAKIKVTDVDFIAVHQGKGEISAAYSLKRDKQGNYIMIDDYKGQKAKTPYTEVTFPDGSKRVSFVDFTFSDYREEDIDNLLPVKLEKTKKGQAQPLQIISVDLSTGKIVPTEKPKKVKAPKAVEASVKA